MSAKFVRTAWLSFIRLFIVPIAIITFAKIAIAQNTEPVIGRLPSEMYIKEQGIHGTTELGSSTRVKIIKDFSNLNLPENNYFNKSIDPIDTQAAAAVFLKKNEKNLGIEGDLTTLPVKTVRTSPFGTSIELEQQLHGIKVIDGGIQIKISKEGELQSVVKNIVKVPASKNGEIPTSAKITEIQARDIVWRDLAVTGELMEVPKVDKAYINENNTLTLAYIVRMAVTKPFGYWEYRIDASTGRIISKFDRRIKEQKTAGKSSEEQISTIPKQLSVSFDNALKKLQMQKSKDALLKTADSFSLTTASAYIFEPNPLTTTKDPKLLFSDPPAKFDSAYRQVTLSGLQKQGGTVFLRGEFVNIEDFEPGVNERAMPPSTSQTGWTSRRGDNAFDDVMAFYHISKSLEYLRSLGYKGHDDLFPAGISVDTDGVDGADNSHYVPDSDKLAFGHGCVDDNEDSDVILHELGHAIHYHVNQSWGGGDSGAIGEGFGDYWAASNRMRMPNGWGYLAGKVFVWDGIDACWGGRRVDKVNAKYNPAITYSAHEQMDGFVADELWSTPLIESLLDLVKLGESIESVDRVVLAGMDGIGRNFTMRSLALHTLEQARILYPNKPHADIFRKYFKLHGIID